MSSRWDSSWPGHEELPDTDGKPSENCTEQFHNHLLISSLEPFLEKRHPDQPYFIGLGVGIYYHYDPDRDPLEGCRAPDWFYVPNVSPLEPNDHTDRRSYVMWKEKGIPPLLIIEQVCKDDGREERDRNVGGKMWVYETQLQTPYYAIFDGFNRAPSDVKLEMYHLENGKYQLQKANSFGHHPIPEMGVALGFKEHKYLNYFIPWLRFFDLEGNILPTYMDLVEQYQQASIAAEAKDHSAQGED